VSSIKTRQLCEHRCNFLLGILQAIAAGKVAEFQQKIQETKNSYAAKHQVGEIVAFCDVCFNRLNLAFQLVAKLEAQVLSGYYSEPWGQSGNLT
jgi:hypothetical protein